jgi:hypothetical protein
VTFPWQERALDFRGSEFEGRERKSPLCDEDVPPSIHAGLRAPGLANGAFYAGSTLGVSGSLFFIVGSGRMAFWQGKIHAWNIFLSVP